MKKKYFLRHFKKKTVNKVKSNDLLIWVISLHGLAFQNKLKDFEARKRDNSFFTLQKKRKIQQFNWF